jgi:hypothetical protein
MEFNRQGGAQREHSLFHYFVKQKSMNILTV